MTRARFLLPFLVFFVAGCSPPRHAIDAETAAYLKSFGPFKNNLEVDGHYPRGLAPVLPGEIVLHFSQPMAPLPLVGKPVFADFVTVTPEVRGTFAWENPRTLALYSDKKLSPNVSYSVRIAAGTESLSGAALLKDFEFSFLTPSAAVAETAGTAPAAEAPPLPPLKAPAAAPGSFAAALDAPDFARVGDVFEIAAVIVNGTERGTSARYSWESSGLKFAPESGEVSVAPGSPARVTAKVKVDADTLAAAGFRFDSANRFTVKAALKIRLQAAGTSFDAARELMLGAPPAEEELFFGITPASDTADCSPPEGSAGGRGDVDLRVGLGPGVLMSALGEFASRVGGEGLFAGLISAYADLPARDGEQKGRVGPFLDRLSREQKGHGGFEEGGFGDDGNFALTLAVGEFLVAARDAGHDVAAMLGKLSPYFDFESAGAGAGEEPAFLFRRVGAACLLSRLPGHDVDWRSLVDSAPAMAPLLKLKLASCLAQARAEPDFVDAALFELIGAPKSRSDSVETGDPFSNPRYDAAQRLLYAAQAGAKPEALDALAFAAFPARRWSSDAALPDLGAALLALRAYAGARPEPRVPVAGRVLLNSHEIMRVQLDPLKSSDRLLLPAEKLPALLAVTVKKTRGPALSYAVLCEWRPGSGWGGVREAGLALRRGVAGGDGGFRAGDAVHVELSAYAEKPGGGLVLTEPLPAGLIGPRERGDIAVTSSPPGARLCGLRGSRDRLAFTLCDVPRGLVKLKYAARAIRAGEYAWPGARIADPLSPGVVGAAGPLSLKISSGQQTGISE